MRDELKSLCETALTAGQDGLTWIGTPANAGRVGNRRESSEREIRKSVVAARKAMAAIDRPMCVGVFGPSQAGKSYLVSVLARQGSSPLMARFGDLGREVDFIREINPGGERESTGLVTRFSMREEASPAGAPVVLRLLSEADVVKILGNSYFLDGDVKRRPPLDPQAVVTALEEARGRAGSASGPVGVTEEDVWDIQEYFERQFAGLSNIDTLGPWWEEAAALAPKLALADRARLFAVLWGGLPQFTALYLELVAALERLGFASDAFCPIEALVPRDESIIDVDTLRGLGRRDAPGLSIRAMSGAAITLPRPVITALAAELRITITKKPWPFFDHTDLLDFPGARSRQPVDFAVFFEDNPDALTGLFLRGKVAFLFDRYVAEQELSSMLLCIKPSNQDVATLPDMIDDWIRISHGETPADRARAETALFLVLTMFDTHFSEKAGDEGQSLADRFQARMGASLTRYFGKAHRWPAEWTPGKPFDNSYWLRNPNFKAEFLIGYDGSTEIGILPDKQEKVAALREACLTVEEVQKHFRDPAKAFDEALRLNDGGVSWLAENLQAICRPEIKHGQIRGRIEAVLAHLRRALAPYWVDSDIRKRLAERREASDRILGGLSEKGQLGPALRMLQVTQNGISEHLHVEYLNRLKRQAAGEDNGNGAALAPATRKAPPLPGRKPAAAAAPAAAQKSDPSREAYLAGCAVRHWLDGIRAVAASETALMPLGMDPDTAHELVVELAAGAQRTGIEEGIAADLRRLSENAIERPDALIEKACFLATSRINRFVSTLGFEGLPEDQRPLAPDGSEGEVRVFARRPVMPNCDALSAERRDFAWLALSEWMYAFAQLVEDNVTAGAGLAIDFDQNERLGVILATLDRSIPTARGRTDG